MVYLVNIGHLRHLSGTNTIKEHVVPKVIVLGKDWSFFTFTHGTHVMGSCLKNKIKKFQSFFLMCIDFPSRVVVTTTTKFHCMCHLCPVSFRFRLS